MRPFVAAVVAILLVGVLVHSLGRASVNLDTSGGAPAMELVVFEHADCAPCQAFRARIAPRYQASPHAAAAPLRYIDVARTDTGGLGLRSPITMVPTAVLMKQGREVDRIAGLWGRDNFFKMVAYMIGQEE
jgi:hypothetical protein